MYLRFRFLFFSSAKALISYEMGVVFKKYGLPRTKIDYRRSSEYWDEVSDKVSMTGWQKRRKRAR